MNIGDKENSLRSILKTFNSAAVGFSGGADSTALLYELSRLNIKAIAFTVSSYIFPDSELDLAKETAALLNIPHKIIEYDPLNDIANIGNNPPDRCYICKKHLFSLIKEKANAMGIYNIIDGSNLDDISDYRPGRKALKELGVISPLEQAGITKSDVYEILKKANLPQQNKKSFACYFSRFPYNTPINKETIIKTGNAEESIRELGITSARLRNHGDLARLETDKSDMIKCITDINIRNKIISYIKNAGFKYVSIDLEGYKTGSMNKTL